MLIVEAIAQIRREHFIKGKTIKQIARGVKVSRNTVRKVKRSVRTSLEHERVVQPRPKLGWWAVQAGAVVIDVGINRLLGRRLVGDVDFAGVSSKASLITPVPGRSDR